MASNRPATLWSTIHTYCAALPSTKPSPVAGVNGWPGPASRSRTSGQLPSALRLRTYPPSGAAAGSNTLRHACERARKRSATALSPSRDASAETPNSDAESSSVSAAGPQAGAPTGR